MKESHSFSRYTHPVVIGGVGGSGTRLIAQCLKELGFFMGYDLNVANDNLWFALLFKRPEIVAVSEEEFGELVEILFQGMTGTGEFTDRQIDLIQRLAAKDRDPHPASWLRIRAQTLLAQKPVLPPNVRWGWKEPNSHIVLHRLKERFPNMKYIQVVRNGMDMAHSRNQNQLRIWGRYFLGGDCSISPRNSLKYWCLIHRRVLETGKTMGANFLFLNYDRFCLNPEDGIMELCGFLGWDSTRIPKEKLTGLVHSPDSIGRYKQYGTHFFDKEDAAYVKELGFETGG